MTSAQNWPRTAAISSWHSPFKETFNEARPGPFNLLENYSGVSKSVPVELDFLTLWKVNSAGHSGKLLIGSIV